MRIWSAARCGNRPLRPAAVVFRPAARARSRPSEAGSMPTIHTGARCGLRRALTIRSVPMLPEPIKATLMRVTAGNLVPLLRRSSERGRQLADTLDPDARAVAGLEETASRASAACRRAGRNDVAGPEGQTCAEVGDLLSHGEDQIRAGGVLHQLVVEPQADTQVAHIRDLLQRADPGAHRQRA